LAGKRAGRRASVRHLANVGFEKYFLPKVREGSSEPGYERYVMRALGVTRLHEKHAG
jgi:sulfide:quinone oxidoreductase